MAWVNRRITKGGEVRYDLGYRTPQGAVRRETFRRLADATARKRVVEADRDRGFWIDPRLGQVTLRDYSSEWMAGRTLTQRTAELYESELRLHILPALGGHTLKALSPADVRQWHTTMQAQVGIGPTTVAKCYRLLRAMLATAVEDELIHRSPCRIRNAGREQATERPTATVAQVLALAEAVAPQRRAMVLVAAFGGLRLAEVLALQRRSVNVMHRRLEVRESTVELAHGELVTKAPKTAASRRDIGLDATTFAAVDDHLRNYTADDPIAYLFTGMKGGQLRRAVWQKEWTKARNDLGLQHLHFHDLRHTHGTLVAQTGATPKETMARLGHATVAAAMRYQHVAEGRDRVIPDAIGNLISEAQRDGGDAGTASTS